MPFPHRRYETIGALLLVLVLAAFALCFKLASMPMQRWDESRLALNAAGILETGDWLVMRYQGVPDLWNTKPPLMIWLQALCIRLLGYQELAVRLPSIGAVLATIVSIILFSTKVLKSFWTGILGALLLLTTAGVIGHHVARTGDYDALLMLWITIGVFSFFSYTINKKPGSLWVAGLSFTLAVLTKGIAGLIILPGLLLYAVAAKELRSLLTWRTLVIILGSALVIVGYYVARESAAPGYLTAVIENEISGRATSGLEDHKESFFYYFNKLAALKFSYWLGITTVGLLINLRSNKESLSFKLALFVSITIGWFLLVLSLVQTKLTWYDAPIYPLLTVFTGFVLVQIYDVIKAHFWPSATSALIPTACLLGFLWGPYAATMDRLISEGRTGRKESETQFGRYLKEQAAWNPNLTTYTLADPSGYNSSMEWYQVAARNTYGHQVSITYGAEALTAGEVVVVCSSSLRLSLASLYRTELLYAKDSCATLRIIQPLAP